MPVNDDFQGRLYCLSEVKGSGNTGPNQFSLHHTMPARMERRLRPILEVDNILLDIGIRLMTKPTNQPTDRESLQEVRSVSCRAACGHAGL